MVIAKFRREFGLWQASLFIFIIFVPNLLAIVNIPLKHGFMMHIFQVGIFLAAYLYGPLGGLFAGLFGSVYSGIIMSNPYLVIGNAILGAAFGYAITKKAEWWRAASFGLVMQIPWLVATDYLLIGMPMLAIMMLVASLILSDLLWAYIASHISKKLQNVRS
jgi:hypothetical protein